MNKRKQAYIRQVPQYRESPGSGFLPSPPGPGIQSYPGLGVPLGQESSPTLFSPPEQTGTLAKLGSQLKDIKVLIDRMGGIDGIVELAGKVQKVLESVSQMTPMIKLLMSSLFNKSGDSGETVRRRRRRRGRRRKGRRKAKIKRADKQPSRKKREE